MIRGILETCTSSVGTRALPRNFIAGISPDGKVFDNDSIAWIASRTDDVNRTTCRAVGAGSCPAGECDVCEEHAVSGYFGLSGPVAVDVERVSILVADEVLEVAVGECAAPAVGFNEHHLVRFPGVDVAILDEGDICRSLARVLRCGDLNRIFGVAYLYLPRANQ